MTTKITFTTSINTLFMDDGAAGGIVHTTCFGIRKVYPFGTFMP